VHAALAAVDLARPEAAAGVVHVLAIRQGADPALAAAALRRVERALAGPVMARARAAIWAAREVPVTAEVDGLLVDGRADLVFEEAAGLVVVEWKVEGDPDDADEQVRLYAAALARALGRPVREALVVPVR
jgi:ATP-dependent exoDNAse (exonuclease V) beta subunit